jgi:hypothetical protein
MNRNVFVITKYTTMHGPQNTMLHALKHMLAARPTAPTRPTNRTRTRTTTTTTTTRAGHIYMKSKA